MTLTVLVPDDLGAAVLSRLDGVRPVSYRVDQPLSDEATHAEVLVPPFLAGSQALELVESLPKLRLVQLLSAGAEAWVGRLPDGVELSTCRGAHGGATAEWVVAVLLAIYRELPGFHDAQRAHRWDYHYTDTLYGKRVLVVGAGDLGTQIRRRLEPFEASVTLLGRTARDGVLGEEELPGQLGQHDAVVLAVPLTSGTRGMADAAFLAQMSDGSVLVNAARGPVVDTEALMAELGGGRLWAALDVTDPEPLPPDHPLWTMDRALLTPHVAASCRGQKERAYAVAAEQITRFANGDDLTNLVHGEY